VDTVTDLTGARVYAETARDNGGRWYITTAGDVLYARAGDEPAPSTVMTVADVENSDVLRQITEGDA
jgi:hypothetical protein